MKPFGKYDDIISLPHHVSARKAPMSMTDRAAQFSPFAALTGFDAQIAETARLTDSAVELADGAVAMLDEKLRALATQKNALVTVTYFRPDPKKVGGAYVNFTGRLKRLDPSAQLLVFSDGTALPFSAILDISVEA